MPDLHELNPVGRFEDRAEDYVKFRPSYPAAAIDAVLAGLETRNGLVVADIGAGTGIFSRILAARGLKVIAIEPGEAMRVAAAPVRRITWLAATAESIGLADSSVDLVTCAQSFHWFRPAEAIREAGRVLRPGGRLALIWNSRSHTDAFTVGYRQAIRDVDGDSMAERTPFDAEETRSAVEAAYGALFFTPFHRSTFANCQRLDLAGLIGRARSASYVPKTGAKAERLVELLTDLYHHFVDAEGLVTLVYETEVYIAARVD